MNNRKVLLHKRRWPLVVLLLSLSTRAELLPPSLAASLQVDRSAMPLLSQMDLAWGRPGFNRRGPRGDAYCLIAPLFNLENNSEPTKVWSNRPTLVWQGTLEWIKLYPLGKDSLAQQIDLPDQTNGSLHSVQLTQALQPGQTYSIVFKEARLAESPKFSLQVMTEAEREQVAADLEALAAQGGSNEEIAIRQATYFADRDLWADFWQTTLAVKNPSQAFQDKLKEIENAICAQPAASPPSPGA